MHIPLPYRGCLKETECVTSWMRVILTSVNSVWPPQHSMQPTALLLLQLCIQSRGPHLANIPQMKWISVLPFAILSASVAKLDKASRGRSDKRWKFPRLDGFKVTIHLSEATQTGWIRSHYPVIRSHPDWMDLKSLSSYQKPPRLYGFEVTSDQKPPRLDGFEVTIRWSEASFAAGPCSVSFLWRPPQN